jgi:hypothetical protein
MLKAQGIKSLIAVGSVDVYISDITLSDHSWVLAEVSPGEYLALETTAGITVPRSKNGQYYTGWTYDTPDKAKEHQRLIREFNTRVEIINDIIAEINQVTNEYNDEVNVYNSMIGGGYSSTQMNDQMEKVNRLDAVKDKLNEIKDSMELELLNIKGSLEVIATPIL